MIQVVRCMALSRMFGSCENNQGNNQLSSRLTDDGGFILFNDSDAMNQYQPAAVALLLRWLVSLLLQHLKSSAKR